MENASNTFNQIYVPWEGWTAVKLLGGGSFGTVYEIHREAYNEKSAMKVIPVPRDMDSLYDLYGSELDEDTVETWCRGKMSSISKEYKVMAGLKGARNIVRCEDYKEVKRQGSPGYDIYIRMELLTPLHKIIRRNLLAEQEIIRLAKDICRALSICEANGIIHRDIKPENIMVDEWGEYKLGDFGIARELSRTTAASQTGSPPYMAPEVVLGKKYGKTIDIYSLGVVMYRQLNRNKLPFWPQDHLPDDREIETAYQNRLVGVRFPEPVSGSAGLKKIDLKACEYDPKDRYQSAEEMLSDLNALAASGAGSVGMAAWDPGDDVTLTMTGAAARQQEADRTEATVYENTQKSAEEKKSDPPRRTVRDTTTDTQKSDTRSNTKSDAKPWAKILAGAAVLLLIVGGVFFLAKGSMPDTEDSSASASEETVTAEAADEETPDTTEEDTADTTDEDTTDYGDEELHDYICGDAVDASYNISGTDLPKEKFLFDFLIRYWLYTGGETEFDPSTIESAEEIMIHVGSDDMPNTGVYGIAGYIGGPAVLGPDPRGWSSDGNWIATTKSTVDWLALNIFNISDQNREEALANLENEKLMYQDGDSYYGLYCRSGLGIPPEITVTNCAKDGRVYYLEFDVEVNDEQKDTIYAVTEIKEVDGTWYWTLQYFGWDKPAQLM